MTKRILQTAFAIAALLWFAACNPKPSQRFTYTLLKETAFDKAVLADNTPLRIIGFSGGQEKTKDKLYYYQFLTVNETNDTIRVLCPVITVPGTEESDVTHTSPLQFDPAKNIFAVQFKNIDTSHMQMLRLMALPSGEMNNSEQVTQVLSGTEPEEVLVTNESIPSFNRPAYKTVRGILHFKEIPW
jgi:hypothetical protein